MHSCHSLLAAQRRINNVWPKPRSLPRRLYLPAAVRTLAPLPSSSATPRYRPASPRSGAPSSPPPPSPPPLLTISLVSFACLCSFCTSSCPIYLSSRLPSFPSLPFPSPHRAPPPCSCILPSHHHPSSAPPDSEPSLFFSSPTVPTCLHLPSHRRPSYTPHPRHI